MLTMNDLLASSNVESRPYQSRIVNRVMECFLQKGMRSAMIESATGSGKTVTALCAAKLLQAQIPDLEIGWVNMRRNLLTQAADENVNKGINAKIHFISMFQKELPPSLLANGGAKHRMLICDESQHDAASSMVHIHNQVKSQFLLGMTATPFRTDRVKLCFDTVIKDSGIGSLIRDGYLSQYHHYTIPKWGVKEACDVYLKEPEHWGKTICYFHRVVECEQAAKRVEKAGLKASVVTGDSDKENQIKAFKAGEVDILFNCMVLTEGFDCPDLKTVICRPSCKSVTMQMCGRAFRKHPSLPFKQIIQPKKGWPFIKLTAPLMQYVLENDDWMGLTLNPKIDELSCKMLQTMASCETEIPQFMLERSGKKIRRI